MKLIPNKTDLLVVLPDFIKILSVIMHMVSLQSLKLDQEEYSRPFGLNGPEIPVVSNTLFTCQGWKITSSILQLPLDFCSLTTEDLTNPSSNSVFFLSSLKKKEYISICGEFAPQA